MGLRLPAPCLQPHPLLAPKAHEDRAPAAPRSVLGGMGSRTENRLARGWGWRGTSSAQGCRSSPWWRSPKVSSPSPPSQLLSLPQHLPSPSKTLPRRPGFGLQPLDVSSQKAEDAHPAQSPLPWGQSSRLRDPDLGLEPGDGAGGSVDTSGCGGPTRTAGGQTRCVASTDMSPEALPAAGRVGGNPGSDPLHRHSGPALLPPEPPRPLLSAPTAPTRLCRSSWGSTRPRSLPQPWPRRRPTPLRPQRTPWCGACLSPLCLSGHACPQGGTLLGRKP